MRAFIFIVIFVLAAFPFRLQAQVGSTCTDPYIITSLPLDLSGMTTNGMGNDYSGACGSSHMNENDFVFLFIPPSNMYVDIRLTNNTTGANPGLFVLDDCPDQPGVNCIASVSGGIGSNPAILDLFLYEDTTYFIIVSNYDPTGILNLFLYIDFAFSMEANPAVDGGIPAVISPVSQCGLTSAETVTTTIENYGIDSLYNFDVSYQIDGGTVITETCTDTILPGQAIDFSFTTPADLSSPLTVYQLKVFTAIANDTVYTNDTLLVTVTNEESINTYPYTDNFEAYPSDWTTGGTMSSWAHGYPGGTSINTAPQGFAIWGTNLSGYSNPMENSWLKSPCYDFSSLTYPEVEFYLYVANGTMSNCKLMSSIDNGQTWEVVGIQGDPDHWYNSANGWIGNTGGWVKARHKVYNLTGEPHVLFRFAFSSSVSNTEGVGIDAFEVFETPANDLCLVSIDEPQSGCGLTSSEPVLFTITNTGTAPQTGFTLLYSKDSGLTYHSEGYTGTINPQDTVSFSFATPVNLSTYGLYNFVGKISLAGDADTTNNYRYVSVIQNFNVMVYPYSENFDLYNGGWYSYGNNSTWERGVPAASVIDSAASSPNVWATNLNGNSNSSEVSYVESPCFNFGSLTKPRFESKLWTSISVMSPTCSLQVEYTTDDGITWLLFNSGAISENWFVTGGGWTGSTSTWETIANVRPDLAGVPNIRFRYAFKGGLLGGEGVAFDDVKISDCLTPDPVANFTYVINGNQASFTSTSSGETSYWWYFGGATPNTSTDQNPTHTYASSGSYMVTLIVFNDCGSDTITQTIDVITGQQSVLSGRCKLYPNPSNDRITVETTGDFCARYSIYDVSGREIIRQQLSDPHGSFVIPVSQLEEGVYFFHFSIGDGGYIEKVLID